MTGTGEYRVIVQHCDREDSPRDFGGNLGVLVLHHKDYVLPREGSLASIIRDRLHEGNVRAVLRWLRIFHGATVALPVIGYDHGDDFKIETVETWRNADRRRLIGVIYDTPDTRANQSNVDTSAVDWTGIAYAGLVAEVKQFDRWTNNDMRMWAVEQYDGQRWYRIDAAGNYFDPAVAQGDGEDELARIRAADAAAGDPAGVKRAANAALSQLREEAKWRASQTARTEADIAGYMDVLRVNDPTHPMYVAPGSSWHCHVQAHNEADTETFGTLFGALDYAADALERLAEHEYDGMAGAMAALKEAPANVSTVEAWRETAVARERSEQYATLAANARALVEQARIPRWRRAAAYSEPDDQTSRDQLMVAANWCMGTINDGSPVGVWDCVDTNCELKNGEDETSE